MNQTDLQTLSDMRLREANALLASSNPCGAYYLAGYSVECAIKACIAKQTQQGDFPDKKRAQDSYEHSLEKLITTANLKTAFDSKMTHGPFFLNWAIVKAWNVEARYETSYSIQAAEDLIEAVQNPQEGVLFGYDNTGRISARSGTQFT